WLPSVRRHAACPAGRHRVLVQSRGWRLWYVVGAYCIALGLRPRLCVDPPSRDKHPASIRFDGGDLTNGHPSAQGPGAHAEQPCGGSEFVAFLFHNPEYSKLFLPSVGECPALCAPHPDLVYGQLVKQKKQGKLLTLSTYVVLGAERLTHLGLT